MRNHKTNLGLKGFRWTLAILAASILCLSFFSATAAAQSGGTIETGVSIPVRTYEEINVTKADGRIFSGEVDQDVRDRQGRVALPRGTPVEMMAREVSDDDFVLDLESVTVNGRRMAVQADSAVSAERKEGVGANSRTGRYVGGGAVIGAIIGAIAGGGKGAAIGAGVGAAGGAGVQVLTRGKSVKVPPESLVTFRLERPLQTGVADRGFSRNGLHYHDGYGTVAGNSAAYDAGLQAGRSDRERSRAFDSRSTRWSGTDLRDYEAGYRRGFDESPLRTPAGNSMIRIGADNYITWQGPANSEVYFQVDDSPRRLFSTASSGTEPAPWIRYGHKYTFVLVDPNGRELAKDENNLRTR